MTVPIDRATEQYAEHRELLFSIAYNILGSVADTEDVLQETWLAWAAASHDRVANVRAYPHGEIATTLGRTPAAVRQLAHRARAHVEARRPRVTVDPEVRKSATEQFLAAAMGGDVASLLEVLAPDVTLWTDGGGKQRAVRQVVSGRDKVVRLLTSPRVRDGFTAFTYRMGNVNGEPAALFYADDRLFAIMVVDVDADDRIRGVYAIVDPDKLHHVSRSMA